MNEAETRAEHIDPALKAAGWGVVEAQAKNYAGKLAVRFAYATNGQGIYEEKLTPLLRLRYHNSLADAVADLGEPEQVGQVFAGFQKFLYEPHAAA